LIGGGIRCQRVFYINHPCRFAIDQPSTFMYPDIIGTTSRTIRKSPMPAEA
jgi:hypothetical protein